MRSNLFYITGSVSIKSVLTLEDIGQILSDRIFGGLKFGGKDLEIYEEVPAIFIQSPILGLKIILQGHSGDHGNGAFNLSIIPFVSFPEFSLKDIKLNNYLFHLLRVELADVPNIEIWEDYL